MILNPIL